jgi:hypothetical protein
VLDGPEKGDSYLYRLSQESDSYSFCYHYVDPTCGGRYELLENMWQWGENIGSPHSLAAFLIGALGEYGAYPNADQIVLSMIGHGGGWAPTLLDGQPQQHGGQPGGLGGLLWDDHPGSSLSTAELGKALRRFHQVTGEKIDFLYLDACLMAMSEVAYEVGGSVDYLLASESWSWTSFPYDEHLAEIDGSKDARQIGEAWLANEANLLRADDYPFTYSLTDLGQMEALSEAQDNLANALIGVLPSQKDKIDAAFTASACFDSNSDHYIVQPGSNTPPDLPLDNYCDFSSFASQLETQFSGQSAVVNAAQEVQDAIATAVVAEDHNNGTPWNYSAQEWAWDELGGISIYTPLVQDEWRRRYYKGSHLRSAQHGEWDEFLAVYWNHAEPPPNPECPPEGCDLPPGPLPTPPVVLELWPSELAIGGNETFEVPILVQAGVLQVDGTSAYLNFDPAYLEVVSITPGSEFSTILANEFDNSTGEVNFAAGSFNNFPSGTFTLATVTFQTLALTDDAGTPIQFNSSLPRQSDATFDSTSVLQNSIDSTIIISNATLVCSVTLQGRPAPPHSHWSVPLDVSLTIADDTTPAYTFTPTTDENGRFTIEGIAAGNYELRLKHSHTLQNKLDVTLTSGLNSLDCGTLLEGDANNDNYVTILDFSIFVSAFGTCEGDSNYNPQADFNGDGCVTIIDFSLLASNFGQGGQDASARSGEVISNTSEANILAKAGSVQKGQVCVDIQVQAESQPVDGAAAYLVFEPTLLQVEAITLGKALPKGLQNDFDNQLGTIDIAAGTLEDYPEGTFELAEVCFNVIGELSQSSVAFQFDSPRQSNVTFGGASILSSHTDATFKPTAIELESLAVENGVGTLASKALGFTLLALMALAGVVQGYRRR